jgi:type IV fimbrial biogenesis protein FimT
MPESARYGRRGFTLAELLVCLSILAVLGAVTYHAADVLMARQQVTMAADRLAASLALARSAAMTRRVEVALQPLDGHITLDRGWQLAATNGLRRSGQDATVLSVVQLDAPCLSVALRQTARASNVLRFAAVGYSRSEQGGFQAATFTLNCRGERRQVRMGAQGRIRLCTPGHDKDCEASGEPAPP